MAVAGLLRQVERLQRMVRRQKGTPNNPVLQKLRKDPANLLALASKPPDPWQQTVLRSQARQTLLLCSRQAGKSTTAAALALRTALLEAPALVLLLSPTQRQSAELLLKTLELYRALGRPVPSIRPKDNALKLELVNGSRILALPGDEEGIRGFSSVKLVILDEAARIRDALYRTVRPMLAVSRGRLVCLSTPFGKRGWFYEAWEGTGSWEKVRIPADQIPRIPKEFLAEEEKALGSRWYRQEYCCSFEDAVDAVFSTEDILAAMSGEVQPLFMGG